MQNDRAKTFMMNCKHQVTRKPSGPTGRMLKGPTGIRQMEKGPSGDFYDELQASRKSNYRSTGTRRMKKGPTGTRRMEI